MAGGRYGMTPMSRLAQHSNNSSSSNRPGRPLDLSSPSSPNISAAKNKKKIPKRKTLSSRYSADVPPKRRKLGLNALNTSTKVHHATASSHTIDEEEETKLLNIKGKAQKAKAEAKAKPRAKAGLNKSPRTELGREGRVLNSASDDLKARVLTSERNEVAPVLSEGLRAELGKQILVQNRGDGKKSSCKRLQASTVELGITTDCEGSHHNIATRLSPSPGCHVQSPPAMEVISPDSSLLEGKFLRPRKYLKKKSEENRLPPWDYVGKRVVVYWPHAKAWFAGKVTKYDDCSKKHKIKYDDDDEECISFRRHKVVLEGQPPLQSAAGSLLVEGAEKFPSVQAVEEVVTTVGPCKPANEVEATCVVEDSTLLSAVIPRHRLREGLSDSLSNGPAKSVFMPKRANTNHLSSHKVCKSGTSANVHIDAIGKSDVSGADGGKAALVYVRRSKGRQRVATPFSEGGVGGDLNKQVVDNNRSTGLERSRKRKKSRLVLQQAAHMGLSHVNISCGLAAAESCDESEGDEHASRKRNRRSLKNLVSQAFDMPGTEGAQGLQLIQAEYAGCDQAKKHITKRKGRKKRGTKHQLANLVLTTTGMRKIAGFGSPLWFLYYTIAMMNADTDKPHESDMSAEILFARESRTFFDHTICLLLPVVTPGLFTWQIFSILSCVRFCVRESFNARFSMNASKEDCLAILRVLLLIIKAIPLSAWNNQRCGRQWQQRILHDFWMIMSGELPVHKDIPAFLPTRAESLMVEHFRGANDNCAWTFRQMLNIFVRYFINPYIIAILCEKGASLKVAVQQFLFRDRSKHGGSTCVRQFVRSIPLHSGAGDADLNFSSYLMLFPQIKNWSSGGRLFFRQMDKWIANAAATGYAEHWVPVPSIKRNNLGWQVTTVHLMHQECIGDESETKVFRVDQSTMEMEALNKCVMCHSRARDFQGGALDHRLNWLIDSGCFKSALLFVSFLQSHLVQKGCRHLVPACFPTKSTLLSEARLYLYDIPTKHRQSRKVEGEKLNGVKEESGLESGVMPGSNSTTKYMKIELDANLSRRNSSITTESNGATIKEESSVELYSRKQIHSGFVTKPDMKRQLEHYSVQIDKEYYVQKRPKDTKKIKKGRAGFQSERRRIVQKELPSFRLVQPEAPSFCHADLVFSGGDTVSREPGVRVQVQLNAGNELSVVVQASGKSFVQRIVQGSSLPKNPPELKWKSGIGWALEFPDREQWELFRRMYNGSSPQNVRLKEIPVPGNKQIDGDEGIEMLGSSLRPYYMIRHPDDELDTAHKTNRVLYDLDTEDETWLVEVNLARRKNGDWEKTVIGDATLERMIDRLEREAHRRGEESLAFPDAVQLCQELGAVDIVRAVHAYWSSKRHVKGKALLRYFQPPLWEQYQKELSKWEMMMELWPANEQDLLPRPLMSAFCLQSRSLDASDSSKKMLRQRSQRKIKPLRSSSEESHRVSALQHMDLGWHSMYGSGQSEHPTYIADGYELKGEELPETIKAARVAAVEARRIATIKTAKFQRLFLEFDSALQKAWALLVEHEALTGGEAAAQGGAFEARMAVLFNRCSCLLNKGNDSSENEPPFDSKSSSKVEEDFLEAFARKCSIDGKAANKIEKVDKSGEAIRDHLVIEDPSPLWQSL